MKESDTIVLVGHVLAQGKENAGLRVALRKDRQTIKALAREIDDLDDRIARMQDVQPLKDRVLRQRIRNLEIELACEKKLNEKLEAALSACKLVS